jgi:hypothetical protein
MRVKLTNFALAGLLSFNSASAQDLTPEGLTRRAIGRGPWVGSIRRSRRTPTQSI